MKSKTLFKGAVLLIICNLIGKALGAVYRIPLARILGGEGMGQYQLAFPLYCLILTISTSGIPVAISKLVAEFNISHRYKDIKKLLWISVGVLTGVSLLGAAVIVFGARLIASLQGNPTTYICYYAIAPAVLFVGVLSAFRGYFQGNLLMFPTAISGVIEQTFKMLFGLYFARKLSVLGTEYAVFGALLGISLSEFIAFVFLIVCYFVYSKKHKNTSDLQPAKFKFLTRQLLSLAVPITLGGLINPITTMVDSLLSVNILMGVGYSSSRATMMLGIQSGVVDPLVNLPVIIAISLGAVLLPNLSSLKAENKSENIKEIIEKCFQITLSISIVSAICFIIFGNQILSFLYGGSFDQVELVLGLKLMMLASANIIFLSLVQISTSILQGLGYSKYPVKTLFIGCLIKIFFNVILLRVPALNIQGAVISGGICYFVVMLLNYNKIHKLTGATIKDSYFYVSIQACFVSLFAYFSNEIFQMAFSSTLSLFFAGSLAVLVFALTYYFFFLNNRSKLQVLSKKTN